MLHRGDEPPGAPPQVLPAVAVRPQVDPLGTAADEDDLAVLRGVEEAPDLDPGLLVIARRPLAKHVDRAVDVGALGSVEAPGGVEDRPRLLVVGPFGT